MTEIINKSSFYYLVFAAVSHGPSSVKMKISSVTLLLKAFLWDREQDLTVAPKPLEIPPPPTSSFALDVPCWLPLTSSHMQVFSASGPLHICLTHMDRSLSSRCTWLSFAQPLGLNERYHSHRNLPHQNWVLRYSLL